MDNTTQEPLVTNPQTENNPTETIQAKNDTPGQNVDNMGITNPLPINVEEKQEKSRNSSWFKPGQTGNPKGRPPKDWTWAQLLEEAAEEMMDIKTKDKDGKVVITGRRALKQLVARKLLTAAAGGNIQAAHELMNRMEGMPKQTVEQTGELNLNVNGMLTKIYGDPESDSTQ